MTTYTFQSDARQRYQTSKRGQTVHVDGQSHSVRTLDANSFMTQVNGCLTRIRGVADGDNIHLHINGRACAVLRIDPTRSSAASASESGGSSAAPMPGVVINWLVQPGCSVKAGDALLVIESMKLQMTIEAPQSGKLVDLPFAAGQTFQRGAVLARVVAEEVAA
jgi:3-methylcrotonyl-CoA carboxylase alpha subunit